MDDLNPCLRRYLPNPVILNVDIVVLDALLLQDLWLFFIYLPTDVPYLCLQSVVKVQEVVLVDGCKWIEPTLNTECVSLYLIIWLLVLELQATGNLIKQLLYALLFGETPGTILEHLKRHIVFLDSLLVALHEHWPVCLDKWVMMVQMAPWL